MAFAIASLACLAAGVIGSLIGAHSLARTDAAETRSTFHNASASIASTVRLGLTHEEQLATSAITYFGGDPSSSPARFSSWTRWARTLRRYPELESIGLVVPVTATTLPAFVARLAGRRAPRTAAARAARNHLGGFSVPSGAGATACFSSAELLRAGARVTPASHDFCLHDASLLAARDTGRSLYAPVATGRGEGLEIDASVYRGSVPPSTQEGRRAAFVGWLREVQVPSAMVALALRGHPEDSVRLRHRNGSVTSAYTGGSASTDGQGTNVNLHNGWTLRVYGPAATSSVTGNGDSLALLVGGCAVSLLVAVLLLLLGLGWRPPVPAPRPRHVPNEDLYDSLTGLPNRGLSMDRAERMIARASRESGLLAGALLIDIDWFEDFNEKLGNSAGDQVLSIVAERLETVVRTHDTVGRLSGDEFVVLVETAARGARLDGLARRIIEALHKPVVLDGFGPSFFLTASIGVAFGRYETPEDLLRDAQMALVAAKAAGKDRYTLFNANMRSVIEDRGVLEADLNTALQERQFSLLYQPVYDLPSGRVVNLETHLRWVHPIKGERDPADFMPIAEETGLIVPIGRWMLEEACTRAAAWNVAGHRVGVSVNVAAGQLNRDGFTTDVLRALQQSGVEPRLLTLQLAETTVMIDAAGATARMTELKRLGVCIAVDDFGSGYAYRADLQRMPLDFLKVDRSSLAASEAEDYRSWLLEAILVFGRDLSLAVIAKGIGSSDQLAAVQAMGCTMAQGDFMGEPQPLEVAERVMQTPFPATPASPTGQVGV